MAGNQWSGLWGERGGAVEGRAVMNSGGKGGAWHQFCVEAISGDETGASRGTGERHSKKLAPYVGADVSQRGEGGISAKQVNLAGIAIAATTVAWGSRTRSLAGKGP